MFAEQAGFAKLIQDAPPVSPVLLIIIAILLVILFIWLLLRERSTRESAAREAAVAREAAAAREASAARDAAARSTAAARPTTVDQVVVQPVEVPNPAMRSASIATPMAETPSAPVVDDLEIIEGIGPKIAGVLKAAGVTSFAQLAAMEPARISEILHAANLRLADPGSWPEQARLAANGDMAGLQSLQSRLKGGR